MKKLLTINYLTVSSDKYGKKESY